MVSFPVSNEESRKLKEDLKNAITCSPSIFKVPECVSGGNPDAFLPTLVSLGLHNNAKKNKMEFYKLYMAIKVREELHLPEFHIFCTRLRSLRVRILACYDTHLEMDAENLASVMLMDALFLLRLLRQMKKCESIDDEIESFNIDHTMLVNDVVKLENQIPFVVFQGILAGRLEGKWPLLLHHFSESLSPFPFGLIFSLPKIMFREAHPYCESSYIYTIVDESHHLLHFMYLSILFFPGHRATIVLHSGVLKYVPGFSTLNAVLEFIQNATELVGLIEKLVEPITMRILMLKKKTTTSSPPVIPSASHLDKLSVNFKSTFYGIPGTKFTKPKRRFRRHLGYLIPYWNRIPPKLTLPAMNINAFTETLFENLLAFEAMSNINPPVYSLYINLMKALIRSTKDVQILKKNGIIRTSHLDNDEEVVKLFHRLGSSIKYSNLNPTPTFKNFLPKTPVFEKISEFEQVYNKIIVEINQYYDSCWRVQAARFLNMLLTCICKMGAYISKMGAYISEKGAFLLVVFQLYKVVMEFFSGVIEFFEPNYDYAPLT